MKKLILITIINLFAISISTKAFAMDSLMERLKKIEQEMITKRDRVIKEQAQRKNQLLQQQEQKFEFRPVCSTYENRDGQNVYLGEEVLSQTFNGTLTPFFNSSREDASGRQIIDRNSHYMMVSAENVDAIAQACLVSLASKGLENRKIISIVASYNNENFNIYSPMLDGTKENASKEAGFLKIINKHQD